MTLKSIPLFFILTTVKNNNKYKFQVQIKPQFNKLFYIKVFGGVCLSINKILEEKRYLIMVPEIYILTI